MKTTKVEVEELKSIIDARTKGVETATVAERAVKDARIAELEYKLQLQQFFLERGLDPRCNVDISTGVISWPEEQEAV
jgi:hypothetical protein